MTPEPGDKKSDWTYMYVNDTYITNSRVPNGAIQLTITFKEVFSAQNLFCEITIIAQNSFMQKQIIG